MSPKLWSYPVVVSQVVVTPDLWEPSQTYPNSHSFQSQDMMFVNCHELPRMCCGLFSLPLAVFQDATRKRLVAHQSQGEQAKQQDDWMKLGGENHEAMTIMDHDFQNAVTFIPHVAFRFIKCLSCRVLHYCIQDVRKSFKQCGWLCKIVWSSAILSFLSK